MATYQDALMEVKQIELLLGEEERDVFAESSSLLLLLPVLHRFDERPLWSRHET